MKRLNSGVSAAVVGAMALGLLSSARGVEPLRVTIEKTNGESTPAYLEKASERAILWKYTPDAPSGNTMAREEIKSIDFEPPDDWSQAEQFFKGGAYAEAAEAYGAIAETYKDIMLLPGNPASMAKYLQIESYRALGDYGKINEILDEATFNLLKGSVDGQFGGQLALNRAWAALAGSNWDVVNQLIAEKSMPKSAESSRTPEFRKELPSREVVQLAYMRGVSLDAAGDKDAALVDYYRCFTLGFGNDRDLSGKATLKALAILTSDPDLETKDDKLREVRALARVYKQSYGSGDIPAEYSQYADYVAPAEESPEASEAPAASEAPSSEEGKGEPPAEAEGGPKSAEGDAATAKPE